MFYNFGVWFDFHKSWIRIYMAHLLVFSRSGIGLLNLMWFNMKSLSNFLSLTNDVCCQIMHQDVTVESMLDKGINNPSTGCNKQGWGQLHNINSNSNSRGFNSNSNSGQSPEYQLQLQLQLRRFQLQLQFQLRQISRISTPTPTPEVSTPTPTPEISTPIPTPTPEFQIQPRLHLKCNQSCSTKLPLPNYNVKLCMN